MAIHPKKGTTTLQVDGFLYEQVAQVIAAQIRSQDLKVGERCPSIRGLCRQFSVSLATAVQAMNLLERQGLVEARPQSGFFVKASLGSDSFLTPGEQTKLTSPVCKVETAPFVSDVIAAARDPGFVPLGAATVSPALLPLNALQRALATAARELGPDAHLYEATNGNVDLRRQIALRSASSGIKVSADDVVITSGCMEALYLALASSCKAGDTIAVETPIFFGIFDIVAALELKVVAIPSLPGIGFDVTRLEAAMEDQRISAILMISNFSNPAGGKIPDERKKKLASIAAKACVPLIEDDIYGDLFHTNPRPSAVKSYDVKGDVVYCSSFSKTLSPGLRIGWMIPGRYIDRVLKLKAVTSIASPTLSQAALAHYLRGDAYDRHLRELRRGIERQTQQYIHAVLAAFPPGTKVSQPEGGFVLWVQLPAKIDARKLFEAAHKAKISIIPGQAFAAGSDEFSDFIRVSCGYPLTKAISRAIEKLGVLMRDL